MSADVEAARQPSPRLWIRSRGHLRVLNVEEVDWIEADRKYSVFHARGATVRVRESITVIEARLDPTRFARIHRSAIVNLDRVVEVGTFEGRPHAVLESGARVPMSRSQKSRLFELIGVDA